MNSHFSRLALGLACLAFWLAPAQGQLFRDTFKKPETAPEFWAAMKYEIEVGNYDGAAVYLKNFLEKNPTDQELLDIEAKEGLTGILQLQTIPALRKESGPLLDRVSQVLQKSLANPDRIRKFIRNLTATPEERAFAIDELRRSHGMAIPFFIEVLRDTNDPAIHASLFSAMLKLGKDTVPVLLAGLDVNDANIRVELIQLLQARTSMEAVPHLWYLSTSPRQPENVRRAARGALSALLGKEFELLPPAKVALTAEANRYYLHQIKFPDSQKVIVWQMQPGGKEFVLPPPVYTATQAEEYYGLHFARQALDLDPTYEPAQIVLLSLAIDKAYERAGLDQPLEKGSPRILDLLRSVNPDLVAAVLDRALADHRLSVILGAVRTLGDVAEIRAARQRDDRIPSLIKAVYYPDRRVQMAAADALLSLPGTLPPTVRVRIVDVLRRNLAAEGIAKALVADSNNDRANLIAKFVKEAGYEPVVVHTGREVLQQLKESTDFDLVLLVQDVVDPDLPSLLAQLRADIDNGQTPVLILTLPVKAGTPPSPREQVLRQLVASYRNAWIVPAALDAPTLKQTLASRIIEATGKPLSTDERKTYARMAILWLRRMAVGELPGFEIEPARAAILQALRTKELNTFAVEAAGAMTDRDSQRELAGLVLNPGIEPELRSQAAVELNRHIQHNGALLAREQAKALEDLFDSTEEGKLRNNLARVIGSLRPNAASTSRRLQSYSPPPIAAPAPLEPEKKEPEKEKPPAKDTEK
jgi:CheY-like chemotaxis protein